MYSYHRVLAVFGKSVHDKTLECDCDIQPWEVSINGENWEGKIRLIGFVDVFFLIAYSGALRFEKGIIVFKDTNTVQDLLLRKAEYMISTFNYSKEEDYPESNDGAGQDDESSGQNGKRLTFQLTKTGEYEVKSWGHEIRLAYSYPIECLQSYEIRIRKPDDGSMQQCVERGIREPTTTELLKHITK